MGNVNETASETAHSGSVNAKELPGALQTGEDDAENPEALTELENLNDAMHPSPSLSTEDEFDPADVSRSSSPVSSHNADSSTTRIATVSSSGVQSPSDGMFDSSTQSSNTSFPILISALPTTFDVAADISFLNPNELSDYFFTPGITHPYATDQVPLSEMSSSTPVASQTGPSFSSSHCRPPTISPTFTGKGASSDFPPGNFLASDALILLRDGDDATKLLSTNAAKGPGGTSDGVSNLSVTTSGPTPATPVTSSGITPVDSDRSELLIQPSVHIPGGTGSVAFIPVAAAHRQPRETLVAIDNVVSVPGVAVSTKSELCMDQEATLANIPLAATYADAANLAAQHPELAKELLNRPLLAPSQRAAPVVPQISYAAPEQANRDASRKEHRRAFRRGGKKCDSQPQPSSLLAQDSKSRHMQGGGTRSRHEMHTGGGRGRIDALPHLDQPQNSSRNQRKFGDSSRNQRQGAHQHGHHDADASRGPLDADNWKQSDGQLASDTQGQLIQDSHETKTFDQSNTHEPWFPVNQHHSSGSHTQVSREAISGTTGYAEHLANLNEWGSANDPWFSETVSTKSNRLPGSLSHNVPSNTRAYVSDARDNLRQAPDDPRIAEQPVPSDLSSRKYHKEALSVVQRGYAAHNLSQPIFSMSSQSGLPRSDNSELRVNGLDPHRFVRHQQAVGVDLAARGYLGNERGCERRFSSGETRQTGLRSTSEEEPRSMSSPPRIVACMNDEGRLHMIGTGWHRARPPTPAMVSTRSKEIEDAQLRNASSTNSGNTGDAHFPKIHHPARNVDRGISMAMAVGRRDFVPSHVASWEDQVICQPDVHQLTGDITRDTVPQSIHSPHSNPNVTLSSIPLPSMPQNDSASRTSRNPTSSNLHLSEILPRTAHLESGFDPRAEGWLTNFGGRGRRPVGESYKASPSRPGQPGNPSVYAYGNRDGQQRGTDPRERPSPLGDAHRYAYGMRLRGDSEGSNTRNRNHLRSTAMPAVVETNLNRSLGEGIER